MTLDGNDHAVFGFDTFNRAVFAARGFVKLRRYLFHRLMVKAVDANPLLQCSSAKLGIWIDVDRMLQMPTADLARIVIIEVLDQ